MRITIFFFFAGIMHLSASVYSQQTKLQVSAENKSIFEVIKMIEKQSDFHFLYRSDNLKGISIEEINMKDARLEEILDKILIPYGLTYEIDDKTIVIKKLKEDQSQILQNQPQKKEIVGTVKDSKGVALPGVTVVAKGTTIGIITDANGQFKLSVPYAANVLVFSFVGMKTQEISLKDQKKITVVMEESIASLEEMVVIGYGSTRKPDLTGSVGVVAVKDLVKAPVASFAEALAGRVAGVQVSSVDGQPGADVNIVIRGAGSLTQSTSPLYVIDGFPVEDPDPATLNPEEIESMTILKDASSTAIYGSRGANGVIVIQTKRGKSGKPTVSFSNSVGYQMTPKPMELMSVYDYIKYQMELDPDRASTRAFFANGQTLEDYKNVKGISYQDYVLRTGVVQIHNIALRGGSDQTKYSVSGSVFDQGGVIINTGLTRYSGRVTIDQSISDKIKVGFTTDYSNVAQNGQVVNQSASSSSNPTAFVLSRVWMYRPISATNEDLLNEITDQEAVTPSDLRVNPFIDLKNQYRKDKTGLFEANGYISYDITKDLSFKSTAGIRQNRLSQERFYNSMTSQGGNTPGNTNGVNGSITNILTSSYSNENMLNFKKAFNVDHTLTGFALFSVNGQNAAINGYGGRLLPNESLGISGIDEGVAYNPLSSTSKNTMLSYATRWDYGYKSKYLLTLTFRADGSSKFVNPWGYFPGAALAWNMQKEGFISKAFPALSTSKLRFSYGSNGNNRVGDFDTYARLVQALSGYSLNNGTPIGAVYVSAVGNPELRWEKSNTIDMGYEFGLFNDRISFELDLYRKTTSDLLLNSVLPGTTGFSSAFKNIGKLQNQGLEFTLTTVNVSSKSFSWQTNFNISFNKNMVMELADGQKSLPSTTPYVSQYSRPLYLAEIGKPAGMMIGYIWDGNYQYADFDNPAPGVYLLKPSVPTNGAVRNTILPGDIKYKDLNADGVVDDGDVAIIGRGQPIHTGGFSNNFVYKGFILNVFFQWSYGNDNYNANRLLLEGNSNGYHYINQFASYANRWSPENQTNANYRTRGQGPTGFHSSRVVEDGSFLRLKTVSLGYALPKNLIKKAYLSDLSFNVSAQNLATWTNYTGMDPEVSTRGNILTPGYDYSSYPRSPTVVFGIKGTF